MGFKNVFLEVEESKKWAKYFENKYSEERGFIGDYMTWDGMTVNSEQTIFVKIKRVNHDDPNEIELFYFWHSQLFSVKLRKIWGEETLQAWDLERLMSYSKFNYERGIHLPESMEKDKEQIFQDLKSAMIVHGRKGIGTEGYEKLDPPLPNIQIRVGGKVY